MNCIEYIFVGHLIFLSNDYFYKLYFCKYYLGIAFMNTFK